VGGGAQEVAINIGNVLAEKKKKPRKINLGRQSTSLTPRASKIVHGGGSQNLKRMDFLHPPVGGGNCKASPLKSLKNTGGD